MKLKSILNLCQGIIGVTGFVASAQNAPTIAALGVQAAPNLAKRYGFVPTSAVSVSVTSSTFTDVHVVRDADFVGSWETDFIDSRGTVVRGLAIISNNPAGDIAADIVNLNNQSHHPSTSIAIGGGHIRIELTTGRSFKNTLEGDIDAVSQRISGKWTAPTGVYPIELNRTTKTVGQSAPPARRAAQLATSDPASTGHIGRGAAEISPNPSADQTLEELIHAIDVRLVDRFNGVHVFTVIDDPDLRQTVPPALEKPGEPYDLKDPKTALLFKQAGIRYFVMTTIEDLQHQTISRSSETTAVQRNNYDLRGAGQRNQRGGGGGGGSTTDYSYNSQGSSRSSQTQNGTEVRKEQLLTFTMRYQLFDVSTGNQLDTWDQVFKTNESYNVLAQGNEAEAGTRLFEDCGKLATEWEINRVVEKVFPIKVLDKNGREITINRGVETGLQEGQVYGVYVNGAELKDPDTGEVLGHKEDQVGKVVIRDLHPKFSSAGILEDTGITPGAFLRRLVGN